MRTAELHQPDTYAGDVDDPAARCAACGVGVFFRAGVPHNAEPHDVATLCAGKLPRHAVHGPFIPVEADLARSVRRAG